MKEWFTSKQLEGFPSIPSTARRIRDKAKRENWTSRPRQGKGMGNEYHISSLPPETQEALRTQNNEESGDSNQAGTETQPVDGGKLEAGSGLAERGAVPDRTVEPPKPQRNSVHCTLPVEVDPRNDDDRIARRNARLHILAVLTDYCRQHALNICECRDDFATQYNARRLPLPGWVTELIPTVSAPTLLRWASNLKVMGVDALAGNYGTRKGSGQIDNDEELRETILAFITQRPSHIYDELKRRFPKKKLPTKRTIERWVRKWRNNNPQQLARLRNINEYNSKFRSAAGSYSENITYALQRIEIDATKGDVFLNTGDKFERYSIIFMEDVFSRRAKAFVTKNSNSRTLVQTCLRWLLLNWGKSQYMAIRTDRGKDFISAYFLGCLEELGIDHEMCTGRSGWEKPFVERLFGTNTRNLLEQLPGYCGHDVAERQAIRSQMKPGDVTAMMTPNQLQEALDLWVAQYENTKHQGEGLDGKKTPLEKWAESPVALDLSYQENQRQLDILLAEAPGSGGLRTVQKKGIRVGDGWFINNDGLQVHWIGKQVKVRLDPFSEQDTIHCFNPETGEYLFTAEDFRAKGINRSEAAKAAHEQQKEIIEEVRQLKQLRDEAPDNVIPFNFRAKTRIQTESERVATEVVEALDAPEKEAQPLTPQQEEVRTRIAQRQTERATQPNETLAQRFFRLYLVSLKDGNEVLSEDDSAFVSHCLEKEVFPSMARLALKKHTQQQEAR
ncbi:MAG: DNA-binding protein [Jaaginema sp. PMC 1079.18]|nr:DNA-binding protein [Jaaginema sp. PMC 1080.18]MEC4850102.1 DNA-binding protein [Jaaginema sp. PMC 1079.18]MEC4864810.1 DNA-binding protein [Jaaginema sp. PMC 1078.18]